MSAGIARRVATGVAAMTAAVLGLSACNATDTAEPEADQQVPADETEETPGPKPRTITFTEPVETELACDCYSQLIGADSTGRVAIAEDLPIPAMATQGAVEDPETVLTVVDGDGNTVWSDDSLTWTDGSVSNFVAPKSWATGSALIARADERTLVGLDWSTGDTLWTVPDVAFSVDPELVPERDDVFVLSGQAWDADGDTYHPRVSAIDATDGSVRWDGREIRDYDVSPDGAFLLTADYGDDGATLTHVDLADGSTTEATVESWRGRGQSLNVRDDGTISAYIGPSGENERMVVEVADWDGDPTVTEVAEESDDTGVPGLPEADEVATHEESGLVLAATLDAEGEPETAVMVDADGNQLWDVPAEEVLRWHESSRSDASGDPEVYTGGAEFVSLPDDQVLVVADRTPAFAEEGYSGSVAGSGGDAFTAYDARSGDELWSWGDQARMSSFAALEEDGVFYVAQGGTHGGGGREDIEPTALTMALLDLRTGEPDWQVDAGPTTTATVHAVDDLVVVRIDGDQPWRVSKRTERTGS